MRSDEAVSAVSAAAEATAEFAALLARMSGLAADAGPGSDADRIDRIALLEQIRAATVAAQHTQMVAFARAQVEAQIADATMDPRRVGRGIGDQIALACRLSPHTGSRRLTVARTLDSDLPVVRALLAAGRISEDVAEQVVSETRHLSSELRRQVDRRLCAASLDRLSPRQAAAVARRYAYEADRAGYVARGRTARADRRVSLRPAPDTMSLLTGFLPVEQGVACFAALRVQTDACVAAGDSRTRGQIMADTLVERVTGQAAAGDVNVEVGLVMSLPSLLDPQSAPVEVTGMGPIPAEIAHDLLRSTRGRRWWRRLFATPADGHLVGGDPRRRRFDGFLAHLVGLRDGGRCRDPYCDAPLRHLDHIRPHRAGGLTTWPTAAASASAGTWSASCPVGISK